MLTSLDHVMSLRGAARFAHGHNATSKPNRSGDRCSQSSTGGYLRNRGRKNESDGVTIRVYSREKTLVDCFCRRNEVGLDVAIEAFKSYKHFLLSEVRLFNDLVRLEQFQHCTYAFVYA